MNTLLLTNTELRAALIAVKNELSPEGESAADNLSMNEYEYASELRSIREKIAKIEREAQ